VQYINIAAATLLIWDCILTSQRKIQLIWPSELSFVKILYFLTRYFGIAEFVLVLLNYAFKPSPTVTECRLSSIVVLLMSSTWILISEVILVLRTWALYGRQRRMGIACVIGFLIMGGVGLFISSSRILKSLAFPVDNRFSIGCVAVISQPTMMMVDFSIVACYETMILALTLFKWIEEYRLSDQMGGLVTVLYRDDSITWIPPWPCSMLCGEYCHMRVPPPTPSNVAA